MNNLSIPEMFRYLFSGIFTFSLLFISDEKIATGFLAKIGGINIVLIALVGGSLFYVIYKSSIYLLIENLQDLLRLNSDNYRTYLAGKYSLSRNEARKLYLIIRMEHWEAYNREYQTVQAPQTHFLYMSSSLLFIFSMWRVYLEDWSKFFIFILLSIIIFICGFISDRFLEEIELASIKKIPQKEIEKLKESIK